jgi:hypothetical protein
LFLEQSQVRRTLNKKPEKWNIKFLNWTIAWMGNSEKPENLVANPSKKGL